MHAFNIGGLGHASDVVTVDIPKNPPFQFGKPVILRFGGPPEPASRDAPRVGEASVADASAGAGTDSGQYPAPGPESDDARSPS